MHSLTDPADDTTENNDDAGETKVFPSAEYE